MLPTAGCELTGGCGWDRCEGVGGTGVKEALHERESDGERPRLSASGRQAEGRGEDRSQRRVRTERVVWRSRAAVGTGERDGRSGWFRGGSGGGAEARAPDGRLRAHRRVCVELM